jgi:hypothetical protein
MAITVPGTQTLVAAKSNHKAGVVCYETADVKRAIPEAKLAAVKAVLQTDCNSLWGIEYGGTGVAPSRDGRGFRARFKAMKTEAEVNTFLAAIETAVTT